MHMLNQGHSKRHPIIPKNNVKSPSRHNQSNLHNTYCSQIQLQAHDLIKNFNQVKQIKEIQRRDKKLKKVYNNLLRVVQKIFDQKFMTKISKDLMNMLNQLVFFYEGSGSENTFCQTQRHYEKDIQKNQNYNRQINKNKQNSKPALSIQINKNKKNHTKKKSNLAFTDRIQNQPNIQNKNSIAEDTIFEENETHELKIFVYSQLKQVYRQVQKEKQSLNIQIKQMNERIQMVSNELQQKMKKTSLAHIIQINALKRQNKQIKQKLLVYQISTKNQKYNQSDKDEKISSEKCQTNYINQKFKKQQDLKNTEHKQENQFKQN